jgi:hypothetical protein
MANRKRREDQAVEALIWRLIITLLGLVVAVLFLRNRKEIMVRYRELQAESPLLAWAVKWTFIVLMIITISTVGTVGWLIIQAVQQS